MKNQKFEYRLTNIKIFCRYLFVLLDSLKKVKVAQKRVDKELQKKISLGIKQVNRSRECSYLHVKHALESEMSEEEIHSLLEDEVANVKNNETIAILFAQHYAQSQGRPDKEPTRKLFEKYGDEANYILWIIQSIMVSDIYSISIKLLQNRLIGKVDSKSSFLDELSITFGILFLVPYFVIKNLLKGK